MRQVLRLLDADGASRRAFGGMFRRLGASLAQHVKARYVSAGEYLTLGPAGSGCIRGTRLAGWSHVRLTTTQAIALRPHPSQTDLSSPTPPPPHTYRPSEYPNDRILVPRLDANIRASSSALGTKKAHAIRPTWPQGCSKAAGPEARDSHSSSWCCWVWTWLLGDSGENSLTPRRGVGCWKELVGAEIRQGMKAHRLPQAIAS